VDTQELSAYLFASHCAKCDAVAFGESDREAAATLSVHRCENPAAVHRSYPEWDYFDLPPDIDPFPNPREWN
jgi:hypothetical protein